MDVLYAVGLTLIAGMATGVGALVVFVLKRKYTVFLPGALAFSAGVMVYVSMIEMFETGKSCFENIFGADLSAAYTAAAFFGGIIVIGIINRFVPSVEDEMNDSRKQDRLNRMGIITAFSIAIHNLPEGLATFSAALKEPALGVAICVAIAIHNIPEGIATAVPIFYSGAGRKKAFWIAFFSGITEPVGAVVGYLFLRNMLNDLVFGIIFGMVAGVMVYISIEELLPMAYEYDNGRFATKCFVGGMAIMALSLVLLG